MKNCFFSFLILTLFSCEKKMDSSIVSNDNQIVAPVNKSLINKEKNTLRERINPPEGYQWVDEDPKSFAYYLENFELLPYDSPILKYDGTPISTQNLHDGVFKIDVGSQDLQQCADAIIRLRAEYLYQQKRFSEIQFHFTSGDLMKWEDYKNGVRAFANGNKVSFNKVAKVDDSYDNFRQYLDLIFTYSGTISLYKETQSVVKNEDLKVGDILITAGSPGHVVLISGACKNKNGERLFLITEGFTPAQSIHLLKNPYQNDISPWYSFDVNSLKTNTARYSFSPTDFRKF